MRITAGLLLTALALQGAADSESVRARAERLHQQQRLSEAAGAHREALAAERDWLEGWWSLGTILYELERFPECRDAFRELTAREPRVGASWVLRGLCEFQTQEYDSALKSFEQARERGVPKGSPLLQPARYHLGALLVREGRFEEGIGVLESLVGDTKTASPEVILSLGLAVLRQGALPSEVSIERRPVVEMAGQAAFLAADSRIQAAQAAYERLVDAHPDAPGAHYAFGAFLLTSDSDRALTELERELGVSPKHVAARLQIALERLKRGEPGLALPIAREAVEIAPDAFEARTAFGRALLDSGRTDEAIAQLEKAVELEPGSSQAYFSLRGAYARAGRKEDAARAQAEFLRLKELLAAR